MLKAIFSPCEKYRYTLWRDWRGPWDNEFEEAPPGITGFNYVNFICLNPSTATDTKDDSTIRKCTKFAKRWKYDGLAITNIFAWRDTDPGAIKNCLLTGVDPVGPENDKHILDIARGAALVIAAWSQHAHLAGRGNHVRQLLKLTGRDVYYLKMGTGKNPEPYHPLYLRDDTNPIFWTNC